MSRMFDELPHDTIKHSYELALNLEKSLQSKKRGKGPESQRKITDLFLVSTKTGYEFRKRSGWEVLKNKVRMAFGCKDRLDIETALQDMQEMFNRMQTV